MLNTEDKEKLAQVLWNIKDMFPEEIDEEWYKHLEESIDSLHK